MNLSHHLYLTIQRTHLTTFTPPDRKGHVCAHFDVAQLSLVDEDVSAVLVMSDGALDESEAVLRIEGLHPTLIAAVLQGRRSRPQRLLSRFRVNTI